MDFDIDDQDSKVRGLGRGLNALFGDDADDDISGGDFSAPEKNDIMAVAVEPAARGGNKGRTTVGIDRIYANPDQPRRVFNADRINELADSIKQFGVLQPILVRAIDGEEGKYAIVAGERRWRAAQIAQLHEVPVNILDMDELAAYKVSLIENLQREDLDPVEEASGYKRLIDSYGQSQDEVAKSVGKSRPHIANMLRLLALPDEVQKYLSSGELSMGHARALIPADDPVALAKEVISRGLSVRQTEKMVAESNGREQKSRGDSSAKVTSLAAHKKEKDPDTLALENDMSNALGMRVSIDTNDGRSGKLTIEFKSLDQLDEVLHRLAHFPGSRLSG